MLKEGLTLCHCRNAAATAIRLSSTDIIHHAFYLCPNLIDAIFVVKFQENMEGGNRGLGSGTFDEADA